jgi:hypothetical protein
MAGQSFPPLLKARRKQQPLWKRWLLIAAAILCFTVGVLGWLLPVITGIPFYILGLILLGMASPRVVDRINSAEAKLSPKWRKRLRDGLGKIPIKKVRESVQR